jgi:hypothetical protein
MPTGAISERGVARGFDAGARFRRGRAVSTRARGFDAGRERFCRFGDTRNSICQIGNTTFVERLDIPLVAAAQVCFFLRQRATLGLIDDVLGRL